MRDEGATDWERIDKGKYVAWGTFFTVAVDLVVYPMEVLKTRLQVETTTKATVFAATFAALRAAARESGAGGAGGGGLRGLYRGFSLYTFGGLPSQGAYFMGYAAAKDALAAANAREGGGTWLPTACVHLGAGLAADVLAAPLWTPTDVIMQRLQIQGPGVVRYRGAAHAARHIWRHEGVRGLFRGLGASIITFGPASAIWWALYEGTSAALIDWAGVSPAASTSVGAGSGGASASAAPPAWISATSGFIAGAVSSIVTNPLDIAKTRLQTQDAYLAEQDVAGSRQHAARLERAAALRAARRTGFFMSIRSLRERQAAAQAQRVAEAAAAPRFGGAATAASAPSLGFVGHAAAQGQRAARETLRALTSPPGGLKDMLLAKASLDLSTARAAAAGERALASALTAARGDGSNSSGAAGGGGGGGGGGSSRAQPPHPLSGSLVARPRRPRPAPAPVPQPPPPPMHAPPPLPAHARRVLAPLISMTPYQSSFSSNRALVDEALDAVRGALRAVDAARVGRLRRAPDAAALAPGGLRRVMAPPPGAAGVAGSLRRVPTSAASAAAPPLPPAGPARVLHRNLWATLRHIWVHEGPSALARGVFPRMMLHGPASAATFVCYEQVLHLSRRGAEDLG